MRRIFIGVGVLALAGAVGMGLMSGGRGTQSGGAAGPRDASGIASPTRRHGPLPDGRFDEIRPSLERRAAAGDTEAAYRLGSVLAKCHAYTVIDDGTFERMLAAGAAMIARLAERGEGTDEALLVDVAMELKPQMDALCAGTQAMRGSQAAEDAARWLDAAAARGHMEAMLEYVDVAFARFPDMASRVEHSDEVARRREKAKGYLEAARRAGDPAALFAMSKAHMRGDVLPHDPERALAYWIAYRRTPAGASQGPAQVAFIERHLRRELDAAAQARAAVLSRSPMMGAGAGR